MRQGGNLSSGWKQRGEKTVATGIALQVTGAGLEHCKRGKDKKGDRRVKEGARVNTWEMNGDRALLRANGE